ncbi:unnamed protein product [Ixodes persulcatus]
MQEMKARRGRNTEASAGIKADLSSPRKPWQQNEASPTNQQYCECHVESRPSPRASRQKCEPIKTPWPSAFKSRPPLQEAVAVPVDEVPNFSYPTAVGAAPV